VKQRLRVGDGRLWDAAGSRKERNFAKDNFAQAELSSLPGSSAARWTLDDDDSIEFDEQIRVLPTKHLTPYGSQVQSSMFNVQG
jgi:hypothetical protein